MDKQKSKTNEYKDKKKRKYVKPEITSEQLIAFGVLCNGVGGEGRKETLAPPARCNASRLLS